MLVVGKTREPVEQFKGAIQSKRFLIFILRAYIRTMQFSRDSGITDRGLFRILSGTVGPGHILR